MSSCVPGPAAEGCVMKKGVRESGILGPRGLRCRWHRYRSGPAGLGTPGTLRDWGDAGKHADGRRRGAVRAVSEVSVTPSPGRFIFRKPGKVGSTVFRPFFTRFCRFTESLGEKKARRSSLLANHPARLPIENGENGGNGRTLHQGRHACGGRPILSYVAVGAISASALPPAADPTALEGGEDFFWGVCGARLETERRKMHALLDRRAVSPGETP